MNSFFWAKLTSQVSARPNLVNWLVERLGRVLLLWQNLWHKAAKHSGKGHECLFLRGMRQKWAILLESVDLVQAQNCQVDLMHS